jgi:hypothetical protein
MHKVTVDILDATNAPPKTTLFLLCLAGQAYSLVIQMNVGE